MGIQETLNVVQLFQKVLFHLLKFNQLVFVYTAFLYQLIQKILAYSKVLPDSLLHFR